MSESVPPGPDQYNQNGLITIHNHGFMESPTFKTAYQRGVKATGTDYWHWRVHIRLRAAALTSKLAGDFVECGVNRGFLSSAIMQFLKWDCSPPEVAALSCIWDRLVPGGTHRR